MNLTFMVSILPMYCCDTSQMFSFYSKNADLVAF